MKIYKVTTMIRKDMYTMLTNEEFTSHDEAVDFIISQLKKDEKDIYIRCLHGDFKSFEYDKVGGILKGYWSEHLMERLEKEKLKDDSKNE